MCNCIKKLETDLVGRMFNRKKVVKAKLSGSFIIVGTSDPETHSEIELTLEGQKKTVIKPVSHFYCPICGIKYPEGEKWNSIPA